MTDRTPCELVTWRLFEDLCYRLARRIRDSGYRPDTIVAIGRGGCMPARLLADLLGNMDMTSFKIEHYRGTQRSTRAEVKYPLCADLSGRRILLVDDVSDTGDTFAVAVAHILQHSAPREIRTATLHHKTVSHFTPSYFAEKIVQWRWVIYPWALAEDLTALIDKMEPPPRSVGEAAGRLKENHGIDPPLRAVAEAFNASAGAQAQTDPWRDAEID